MTILAKIDDEEIRADDFVRLLRLQGKYDQIMEDVIVERMTILSARRVGLKTTDEEVQEKFNQLRRANNLHRAKATQEFLKTLGVNLEELEIYIRDMLCKEKMVESVITEATVEEYFTLNSPDFDSIEVAHIVLGSEGEARELVAILNEDPDSFGEYARNHSLDGETCYKGGNIGKVLRGSLLSEVEAKVFNAEEGAILGPFPSGDGNRFEIFKVINKYKAMLDDATKNEVGKKIYDNWLDERAKEHRIEIL